jgi:hypothetical protein
MTGESLIVSAAITGESLIVSARGEALRAHLQGPAAARALTQSGVTRGVGGRRSVGADITDEAQRSPIRMAWFDWW